MISFFTTNFTFKTKYKTMNSHHCKNDPHRLTEETDQMKGVVPPQGNAIVFVSVSALGQAWILASVDCQ